MTVLPKLATSLNRRDEVPNQELAADIARHADKAAVKELVENLHHKDKNIQNDCIKVLYETGTLQPALIASYIKDFISLLDSSNNRMQWGAMTALHTIAGEKPKEVFAALGKLAAIADAGSVITKDNFMGILIKLYTVNAYTDRVFVLLNEQLLGSLPNQLPMYAENILPVLKPAHLPLFRQTLTSRLKDVEKESKRKRVEKVIKKAGS